MNELLTTNIAGKARTPIRVWLLVALVVAVVLAANAHLVYVATTSQPACVDHVRPGEARSVHGQFSAAQSSCNSGDAP
jgi:hypothetical protein